MVSVFKWKKITRLILLLSVVGYSCKVSRVSQKQSRELKDTTTIKEVFSDTLKKDTTTLRIDTIDSGLKINKQDTLTIIGVGDIMMGTNFPDSGYLPPHGGKFLLDSVKSYLMDANISFGNLEGVILDEGGTPKKCNNPDLCYLFRSPLSYATHLKKAGFDVLSIANNHAGDFGDEGRQSTMKQLDSVGIYYAGLLTHPYTVFQKDSIRYGMIAFAPNTGTVSINDLEQAKKLVTEVDSLCDVLIISFHGGAEGKDHRHVTRKTETYYGEDRGNVYEFAHLLIDYGADIIFGHGPHVTRAMELYKNRIIAYSLGNFCTYARFNLSGSNGLAPILKLHITREGKFISGKVIPVVQIGSGTPIIDNRKRVISEIRELMMEDFPETLIQINDDGDIFLKD
jgi:poly-gamma-glutamate capsule biosynthesis protein CapA/YwtB (metallophosphatase superfamily)